VSILERGTVARDVVLQRWQGRIDGVRINKRREIEPGRSLARFRLRTAHHKTR